MDGLFALLPNGKKTTTHCTEVFQKREGNTACYWDHTLKKKNLITKVIQQVTGHKKSKWLNSIRTANCSKLQTEHMAGFTKWALMSIQQYKSSPVLKFKYVIKFHKGGLYVIHILMHIYVVTLHRVVIDRQHDGHLFGCLNNNELVWVSYCTWNIVCKCK